MPREIDGKSSLGSDYLLQSWKSPLSGKNVYVITVYVVTDSIHQKLTQHCKSTILQ